MPSFLGERAKPKQLAQREPHAARMEQAEVEGVTSKVDAMGAQEAARAVREDLLVLKQQIADITIRIADRQHSSGSERLGRELELRQAEVGLAEAEAVAALGELRAPEAGNVESLLVAEEQVAQAGARRCRSATSARHMQRSFGWGATCRTSWPPSGGWSPAWACAV